MNYLLLLTLLVPTVAAQCSFKKDNIVSIWKVKGNTLWVEFINKNITNEHWTGIAFGENMYKLEIVVAKIMNNEASLVTGHTFSYGGVKEDPMPSVEEKLLSYNSNVLKFGFTRPLGKNGPREHSLKECQKWHFMKEGDIVASDLFSHRRATDSMNVCLKDCMWHVI
ncbi:hypothetical protein V3C99_004271 [Haemonchus contortus]|uniref:DOMON domain containing protein n=1 Tax=Haemonchus contortus TaxID=6289 RepID=W6NS28_HAECO